MMPTGGIALDSWSLLTFILDKGILGITALVGVVIQWVRMSNRIENLETRMRDQNDAHIERAKDLEIRLGLRMSELEARQFKLEDRIFEELRSTSEKLHNLELSNARIESHVKARQESDDRHAHRAKQP